MSKIIKVAGVPYKIGRFGYVCRMNPFGEWIKSNISESELKDGSRQKQKGKYSKSLSFLKG